MAKRSGRKSSRSRRAANVQRYRPSPPRPRAVPVRAVSLSPFPSSVLDRRTWHPAGPTMRPLTTDWQSASRPVAVQRKNVSALSQTKAYIRVADPRRVLVCVRRAVRKQIMFANGSAGSKNLRKPRFNETSKIGC